MQLIDTHCHIKELILNNCSLESLIKKANKNFVTKIIMVSTNFNDFDFYYKIVNDKKYENILYYTLGIHPLYIKNCVPLDEIDTINKIFYKKNHYLPKAIGEIGLDFYKINYLSENITKIKQLQIDTLKFQIQIAQKFNLPIILHCRNAFSTMHEILDKEIGLDWSNVIFHCFSENLKELQIIMNRKGKISFTGNITYDKNKYIKEVLLNLGVENLILETDSPYLIPNYYNNKLNYNDPSKLYDIANFCSNIFNESLEKIAYFSFNNSCSFFKINK